MPKSIPISNKKVAWLKTALESKFGLKIEDTHSCIKLSDLIFETSKVSINYNTLRRLFEIVPNQNAPSLYTLNQLSKVLGFTDFQNLQTINEKLDKDFIHETLHIFKISKNIDDDLLQDIIDQLIIESWESVYQLSTLIELLIHHKKLENLTYFLSFEFDEKDWDKIFKYYIAFQQIHLEAKVNNEYVIHFIANQINQSKILQIILLQLYVEEVELNGYFGKWISSCTNYLTSDMDVFLQCIKVQMAFQNKDFTQAHSILTKINSTETINFHPILLGRISAWNYLLKNDDSKFGEYVNRFSNPTSGLSVITFFYRLILEYGSINQFISLDHIEKFPINDINFNLLDFNKKAEIELYYLLLAKYYFEKNEIELSNENFQKVTGKYRFSCTLNFFEKEYQLLKKQLN